MKKNILFLTIVSLFVHTAAPLSVSGPHKKTALVIATPTIAAAALAFFFKDPEVQKSLKDGTFGQLMTSKKIARTKILASIGLIAAIASGVAAAYTKTPTQQKQARINTYIKNFMNNEEKDIQALTASVIDRTDDDTWQYFSEVLISNYLAVHNLTAEKIIPTPQLKDLYNTIDEHYECLCKLIEINESSDTKKIRTLLTQITDAPFIDSEFSKIATYSYPMKLPFYKFLLSNLNNRSAQIKRFLTSENKNINHLSVLLHTTSPRISTYWKKLPTMLTEEYLTAHNLTLEDISDHQKIKSFYITVGTILSKIETILDKNTSKDIQRNMLNELLKSLTQQDNHDGIIKYLLQD